MNDHKPITIRNNFDFFNGMKIFKRERYIEQNRIIYLVYSVELYDSDVIIIKGNELFLKSNSTRLCKFNRVRIYKSFSEKPVFIIGFIQTRKHLPHIEFYTDVNIFEELDIMKRDNIIQDLLD